MVYTTTLQKILLYFTLLFSLAVSVPTARTFNNTYPNALLWTSEAPKNDSEGVLIKRDSILYKLWSSIPGSQKVTGSSAIFHKWDRSANVAYGLTFLYGCTGILISDPDFMIVGKLP
jgi:hypothetical protein